MPHTPFELTQVGANALWSGIRPGMTRAEVCAALEQRGVDFEDYADGGATASTDHMELDLDFTADGSDYLWQITITADQATWNGQEIVDLRLGDALKAMGSPSTLAWESKVNDDPSSPSYDAAARPPSDQQYLDKGTLWLPERGLGISLYLGEVEDVVWRDPRHLPKRYAGPVTEAQLKLANRPDLETILEEDRSKRIEIKPYRDPLRPVRILITIIALAGLAWTIKLGFEDDIRWKQASTVTARLVAIEKLPMKQFRDYVLPPLRWIFPRQRTFLESHYRLEFVLPGEDTLRQTVLERGEFYVTPTKPGEEVDIMYLPGDPLRTKGPFRARDAGFVDYTPTVIAIGGLWLILAFGVGLIPWAFRQGSRLAKRLAPVTVIKDPNRPELR